MSNSRLVWSDDGGDQRKQKQPTDNSKVVESNIQLNLRRLTSGKGRTVIEITGLPNNKKWCQALAKNIKKKLGVGGTFKNGFIEIHGEKIELVCQYLDSQNIKWKKTGG